MFDRVASVAFLRCRSDFLRALCVLTVVAVLALSWVCPLRLAAASEWSAFGEDYPYLEGLEAMVTDEAGNVLYTYNADTVMSMASITKVMTAVLAIESGLPLNTPVVVPDSVMTLDPASSVIGYVPGEEVTLTELLWGLLVHSGNDAALVIAELVAGSEAAFVDMMNAKAFELGLYNTSFANPHGLDQVGHYSTAADLIVLGRYAMSLPLFASIVGATSTTVMVGGVPMQFTSTNELLDVYPGMRGIKTGYTYGAGRAFLGVATRGGQTVYVVVLGTDSNETRWADTVRLLDWAFAHYTVDPLASASVSAMGPVSYADRFGWVVPTSVSVDANCLLSPFGSDSLVSLTVYSTYPSFAEVGEQVAQLVWESGGTVVGSRSLTAGNVVVPYYALGSSASDDFYGLDRF